MIEKLDFMVRFWQLKARHREQGVPLRTVESVELLALLRLMATDQQLPEPGPPPVTGESIPVEVAAPGGFVAGDLRLICADGVLIACEPPLVPPGTRTALRLTDAVSGLEYTIPCTVEWSCLSTPSAMALRVDGAPSRVSFSMPAPVWRSPFGRSEPPHTPAQG
jgi:hypothetical protein